MGWLYLSSPSNRNMVSIMCLMLFVLGLSRTCLALASISPNLTIRAEPAGHSSLPYLLRGVATHGKELYEAWKTATRKRTSNKPFPSGLNKIMSTTYTSDAEVAAGVKLYLADPFLRENPIQPLAATFTQVYSTWPRRLAAGEDPWAEYTFYVSQKEGILIAETVDPAETVDSGEIDDIRRQLEYSLSEILWWTWVNTVKRQKGRFWRLTHRKSKYSNLRVIQFGHLEESSKLLLWELTLHDRREDVERLYDPRDQSIDTNPFWAVLGTAEGQQVIGMLTSNVKAMEKKGIEYLGFRRYLNVEHDEDDEDSEEWLFEMWVFIDPGFVPQLQQDGQPN